MLKTTIVQLLELQIPLDFILDSPLPYFAEKDRTVLHIKNQCRETLSSNASTMRSKTVLFPKIITLREIISSNIALCKCCKNLPLIEEDLYLTQAIKCAHILGEMLILKNGMSPLKVAWPYLGRFKIVQLHAEAFNSQVHIVLQTWFSYRIKQAALTVESVFNAWQEKENEQVVLQRFIINTLGRTSRGKTNPPAPKVDGVDYSEQLNWCWQLFSQAVNFGHSLEKSAEHVQSQFFTDSASVKLATFSWCMLLENKLAASYAAPMKVIGCKDIMQLAPSSNLVVDGLLTALALWPFQLSKDTTYIIMQVPFAVAAWFFSSGWFFADGGDVLTKDDPSVWELALTFWKPDLPGPAATLNGALEIARLVG